MSTCATEQDAPHESWKQDLLLCQDLPARPQPELGIILVTGASGYIGGRLVPELVARGYRVRVMVRGDAEEYARQWPGVEITEADALSLEELREAFQGVYAAYYLIHSLLLGPENFAKADRHAAHNFRVAAEEANVKRIIYLGALGDMHARLSEHLRSRAEVADELRFGMVPVTVLRASIIIGSGSASYELIMHLTRSSYLAPLPRWTRNRCQPIAVRDVIKYLVGVLEIPQTMGKSFDIGGRDVLTYESMLRKASHLFGDETIFIPTPFSNIRFYAYFASLHTPVPNPIIRCLFEGLRNEVICQDDSIKLYLPFDPLGYEEAIRRAMYREAEDTVQTRWSDAYPPTHELAQRLRELSKPPRYITSYSLTTQVPPVALFRSVCRIGGKEGWFWNNWMWRLRGMIDRVFLGVGTARGRKSYSTLHINDVIDFWRVEDLQEAKRLLLRAEMKIPGNAWLEFQIKREGNHNRLSLIAYYDTNGFFGRLYWFVFLPFHHFIFQHLLEQIVKRSLAPVDPAEEPFPAEEPIDDTKKK